MAEQTNQKNIPEVGTGFPLEIAENKDKVSKSKNLNKIIPIILDPDIQSEDAATSNSFALFSSKRKLWIILAIIGGVLVLTATILVIGYLAGGWFQKKEKMVVDLKREENEIFSYHDKLRILMQVNETGADSESEEAFIDTDFFIGILSKERTAYFNDVSYLYKAYLVIKKMTMEQEGDISTLIDFDYENFNLDEPNKAPLYKFSFYENGTIVSLEVPYDTDNNLYTMVKDLIARLIPKISASLYESSEGSGNTVYSMDNSTTEKSKSKEAQLKEEKSETNLKDDDENLSLEGTQLNEKTTRKITSGQVNETQKDSMLTIKKPDYKTDDDDVNLDFNNLSFNVTSNTKLVDVQKSKKVVKSIDELATKIKFRDSKDYEAASKEKSKESEEEVKEKLKYSIEPYTPDETEEQPKAEGRNLQINLDIDPEFWKLFWETLKWIDEETMRLGQLSENLTAEQASLETEKKALNDTKTEYEEKKRKFEEEMKKEYGNLYEQIADLEEREKNLKEKEKDLKEYYEILRKKMQEVEVMRETTRIMPYKSLNKTNLRNTNFAGKKLTIRSVTETTYEPNTLRNYLEFVIEGDSNIKKMCDYTYNFTESPPPMDTNSKVVVNKVECNKTITLFSKTYSVGGIKVTPTFKVRADTVKNVNYRRLSETKTEVNVNMKGKIVPKVSYEVNTGVGKATISGTIVDGSWEIKTTANKAANKKEIYLYSCKNIAAATATLNVSGHKTNKANKSLDPEKVFSGTKSNYCFNYLAANKS